MNYKRLWLALAAIIAPRKLVTLVVSVTSDTKNVSVCAEAAVVKIRHAITFHINRLHKGAIKS